ncbi:PREDICTED: uncharacterized protein LOC109356216 [Lupinus angustifolius]|uniref:uncharacterized protein LOC109356216 n=1 Tax=Lupinus angustifolius TaxID=3871 RepID=UPI00092F8411|nr:PREDICTED: uncharacterized protein LOC109356216 [Lupinus angustifolius]
MQQYLNYNTYYDHNSATPPPSSLYGTRPHISHAQPQAFTGSHPYAMNVSTGGTDPKNSIWFPDSGATNHITSDPTFLHEPTEQFGPEHLYMGNGTKASISYAGHTSFPSPFSPHISLSLNNLLLVPSITKNLISVSQFAKDNNCFFEFHPNECFVKSQDSNTILLKGSLTTEGLYAFPSLLSKKSTHCTSGSTSKSKPYSAALTSSSINNNSAYSLWHYRLGHEVS